MRVSSSCAKAGGASTSFLPRSIELDGYRIIRRNEGRKKSEKSVLRMESIGFEILLPSSIALVHRRIRGKEETAAAAVEKEKSLVHPELLGG